MDVCSEDAMEGNDPGGFSREEEDAAHRAEEEGAERARDEGGRRCRFEGCGKLDVGGGLCKSHGGGRRCGLSSYWTAQLHMRACVLLRRVRNLAFRRP